MKPGNGSRLIGIAIVIALAGMGLMFLGVTIDEFSRRGFEYVIAAMIGEMLLFSMLMFGPVGKAIAGLLEATQVPDQGNLNRLADLEDRLAEISGEVARVNELESRLDFAERLLALPAGDFRNEEKQ